MRKGATYTFPERLREYATSNQLQLPEHVERQLVMIEALNLHLKAADKQLMKIADEDPVCRRLMTIPGVGPVTAVRFVAAIDDVKRFENAHAVASYLGLTPGENSSSERNQKLGITKAGSSEVRRALVQAAWAVKRTSKDPMAAWAEKIEARRGKFISVVALARKLSGIMFAMWRDGTSYHPSKSATKVAEAAAA